MERGSMVQRRALDSVFQALIIDDEGRACADIPEAACREEPRNFFTHVLALSLSKSADGLIDPKLALSWLLTALGAPAYLVGLLVPVREAGALLPQLFTAGYLRRLPRRKFAWTAGAFVQGAMAIVMALAALAFQGLTAGLIVISALTILALARSVCSVTYKDVLGKTVAKSRRGRATGMAGSASAAIVILYALALTSGIVDRMTLVIGGLFVAGICWIAGAIIFASLKEEAGASDGGQSAFKAALANLSLIVDDAPLRQFILTRALLTATALAPPFMVSASARAGDQGLDELGFLILASATAGLLSAYVWGALADRSSRKVLLVAGLVGAVAIGATALAGIKNFLQQPFVLPVLIFVLMIAYQGVRLGRSTHLVDMASEETRAAYTALSNTVIGVVLLAGGLFSLIAAIGGALFVLAIMALMCLLGALSAYFLAEVQSS